MSSQPTQRKSLHLNLEPNEYNYIFSHLLKAPLLNISSLIVLLIEDNKKYIDYIGIHNMQIIDASVQNMHTIMSDVITFLNIEYDDNKNLLVNLNYIIHDLKEKTNIPFNLEILTPLPSVFTNKIIIINLFKNLFINSSNNFKNGQGLVEIDYEDCKNCFKITYQEHRNPYNKIPMEFIPTLSKQTDYDNIKLLMVQKLIKSLKGNISIYDNYRKELRIEFTIPH